MRAARLALSMWLGWLDQTTCRMAMIWVAGGVGNSGGCLGIEPRTP